MFITLEGGEGSGKSTAIKAIVPALTNLGYDVTLTREPGGTPISEEIRNVILDKNNVNMDPMTEALLYAASRRQHIVSKIKPALKEGKIVICDRFLDSSLAYQGGARGLGIEKIYELNQYATEGLLPDLTFFFELKPEDGLSRIKANTSREINRLDIEQISFHKKVYDSFEYLCNLYPNRIIKIDASKTPQEVANTIMNEILKRIK